MTEDEARAKWCPFARCHDASAEPNYRCIASDCMAWRAATSWTDDGSGVRPVEHGYCGLAGRPD